MAYSIGCKTFKRALLGSIATMSFVSFAALAQYELPPVEVVGTPLPEPPSGPWRPESHEWNWFNPVPRPSFDPQVAIVSNRKRDDCGGNPVDRFSGSKIEPETDFVSAGDMGLTLRRTYTHSAVPLAYQGRETAKGLFGPYWRSTFDYSLEFTRNSAEVWAWRPDGRRILYVLKGDRWEEWAGHGRTNPRSYVIDVLPGNGIYYLFNEDNSYEIYKHSPVSGSHDYLRAYIAERRNEHGETWSFIGMPQLTEVRHSSGRSVRFGYANGLLTQITDPDGEIYRYDYAGGVLKAVTQPGPPATSIVYHYDNPQFPGALTGKSYGGVRYSTFAYDGDGRAVSSEHAGGVDRHTFSYAGLQSGTWRVSENNPLGRRTVHTYEGGRKVGISGEASPACPAANQSITYDANGRVDVSTDFAGNRTDHDFDAHGHLLKKVEGAGTPLARTTRYSWDEASNRLSEETLEGIRRTTIAYTQHGRRARVDVHDLATGAVRTTTFNYTYHGNGLPATISIDASSPEGDVTKTYSATGDLLQVRNGAGHATTYSGHNNRGQPNRVTSPAGAVTEYEYDGRGRVIVQRKFPSGSPVETRYAYGASGLLDAEQAGDGNTIVFHYDAARRLVQEDMTEPDGSFAVRRTTYNAMSQPIRVEIGRDP